MVFNWNDVFWYPASAESANPKVIIPLPFPPAKLPEVCASVNEPVTTLVTNNDSPPFAK